MYSIISNSSLKALLAVQAPPFLIAFVIAAMFFKWGSFALECLGFLVLWFILDAAYTAVRFLWQGRKSPGKSMPG